MLGIIRGYNQTDVTNGWAPQRGGGTGGWYTLAKTWRSNPLISAFMKALQIWGIAINYTRHPEPYLVCRIKKVQKVLA